MSLLVDLSRDSLDPGYAEATARRKAAGTPPSRHHGLLLAVGVLAATLLVAVAAVQTRDSAPSAARSRAALLQEVNRQSASVTALERALARLRAEQAALRDATLASSSSGAALARQIATQELVLGTTQVAGPGLRVTVGDAQGSGPRNRVTDSDLQQVVNALWAAGAEAIAVNGARLTEQSAIRQAGDAVLVDFRPLVSPYVVSAVGAPVPLETGFGASRTAARLRGYVQLYGLQFHYARAKQLVLPAAADVTLRYASPAATKGPS